MNLRACIAAVVTTVALAVPVIASADPASADGQGVRSPTARSTGQRSDSGRDFGPNGPYYSNIDSYSLVPFASTMDYTRSSSTGGFFCQAGSADNRAVGQIHLPHGVSMNFFRVWLNDQSAQDVSASLQESCLPDFAAALPTNTELATVTSSGSAGAFSDSQFFTERVADNTSCTYRIVVQFGNAVGACPGSMWFYKGRIEWDRVPPPAPLAATFSDVPTTHPFFRFIEALADTGITAGCTASTYCPDLAVTRGQMAAFLARALALQPNFFPDPANP